MRLAIFLGEALNNYYLSYLAYSPVFESARLAGEKTSSFYTNVKKARDDFPMTHDTFCRQ